MEQVDLDNHARPEFLFVGLDRNLHGVQTVVLVSNPCLLGQSSIEDLARVGRESGFCRGAKAEGKSILVGEFNLGYPGSGNIPE